MDNLIYFEDNYNYKCVLLDSLSFVISFALTTAQFLLPFWFTASSLGKKHTQA